jgi:hypothetical protein
MAVARAKGKLRGKKPKLSDRQQKELGRMHKTGEYSISDLAELFSISRPTVYRTRGRQPAETVANAARASADDPTYAIRWGRQHISQPAIRSSSFLVYAAAVSWPHRVRGGGTHSGHIGDG